MADRRTSRFPAYLQRALELLARDAPGHFARARDLLAGRGIAIAIGDAPRAVVCLGGAGPWVGGDGDAHVVAGVGQEALDALLRGELGIEAALAGDRLAIRGSLTDVVAALDALLAWLHGALRCPALAELRREYLRPDASNGDGSGRAPS